MLQERSPNKVSHPALRYSVPIIVLALIGFIYLPVIHSSFVWDDWRAFHDTPWLTKGDAWKHYIFRDFNTWGTYFRPLGVALFAIQVRLFDSTPAPMHAVSLCMHLIDTALVGWLSLQLNKITATDSRFQIVMTACSMLIYGLHPALTEPVSWIGCQFDLLTTMFMLLGIIANISIGTHIKRGLVVAAYYFLAACSKEEAAALPIVIAIFDWMLFSDRQNQNLRTSFKKVLQRNWITYCCLFASGIVFLAFRYQEVGALINPFDGGPDSRFPMLSGSTFVRFQEVCASYLFYWRMILWPMPGIGPIHPVDIQQFQYASITSIFVDVVAACILLTAFYLTIKRASAIGCVILAVTAQLLLVLHIVPINFDYSFYHERYIMPALSIFCASVPLAWIRFHTTKKVKRLVIPSVAGVLALWIVFAVVDVRLMLPMWANDVNLWQWALAKNPHNFQAKDNLLNTYLKNKDYASAHTLGDYILADRAPCSFCLLLIAQEAVKDKDPERARLALNKLNQLKLGPADKGWLYTYYIVTGKMLVLSGKPQEAEEAFAKASSTLPLDVQTQLFLATALALQGKEREARDIGNFAIRLLPENQRVDALSALNASIAEGNRTAPKSGATGQGR